MNYTEILIYIRKIVRSLNIESKRVQKEYGLSIPQLLCLIYLSESKNYMSTQKGIADFLKLNSSTVTGIVTRLEKKGLVARLPKMGDKRVNFIALTSSGSHIVDQSPGLLHDRLSSKLKDLPENKVIQIEDALKTLIDCLEIDYIPASPLMTIDDPLQP